MIHKSELFCQNIRAENVPNYFGSMKVQICVILYQCYTSQKSNQWNNTPMDLGHELISLHLNLIPLKPVRFIKLRWLNSLEWTNCYKSSKYATQQNHSTVCFRYYFQFHSTFACFWHNQQAKWCFCFISNSIRCESRARMQHCTSLNMMIQLGSHP